MIDKQLAANQKNALKSTGPKTPKGKEISSDNSLKHGILSSRLFIGGENPEEFFAILEELHRDLRPGGYLEETLLQKIAIILWRQKRLLAAENAVITLNRQETQLLEQVNKSLGISPFSNKTVTTDDLIALSSKEYKEHKNVLKEVQDLWKNGHAENLTIETIRMHAPTLWKEAEEFAKQDSITSEEYFADYLEDRTLYEWLDEFRSFSYNELKLHDRQPYLASLHESAQDAMGIPDPIARESLTRYQASLDNQLYKAMKAFWLQQEFRLKRPLDVTPADDEAA